MTATTTAELWVVKGTRDMTVGDPVLLARVEALRLLADRVSDQVVVLGRDHTILYSNRPGCPGGEGRPVSPHPARCYEALLGRSQPCAVCPATKVFESGDVRAVSCATDGGSSDCGMLQAFPLRSSQGDVACALVLFETSRGMPGTGNSVTQPEEGGIAAPPGIGDLIGQSTPMRQLFEMIRLVADSQATVLLQGESGTGKELVARTIHQLSYRREKPFVVVDCGSLPESLLESELFGHVKGAFTGAVLSKKGLFEEADGGTVFLDEIADTSGHFQSKLLRVLQEGEIKPVGSNKCVKVNVRVISATNRDLLELVKAKAFREDLYYRLAVLPLSLPPLRERREDIPLLVRRFVEQACERHRKPLLAVASDTVQALAEAPWPGNIRELQHAIERAVVTASGPQLTHRDVFGPSSAPPADADLRSVTRKAMQSAERPRIEEALRQAGGNRARAARALKISRANLYNKLRAYHLA